jgi:hypothetical protein
MVEKLTRQLHSLRRRTLGEVLSRVRVGGHQWLEKRGMGLAGLPDEALLAQLEIPGMTAMTPADAAKEYLARRWARPWLSIGADAGRLTADALALSGPELQALRVIADDACNGRFRLLGYPHLDFGTPIDWHYDPVHQKRAPLRHWSRVPYLDPAQVGDHKIIWELNRHQFLVTLGQVFALTGEERYAAAAVSYLLQWMAANPPSRGINWSSSLEVGLRAISWSWCLRHIVHSQALSARTLQQVLATLVRHGLHIERYLSTYFSPNTHLTGEALALLYLGTTLPEGPLTARWKARGIAVLESELRRQLLGDGVYFEKSTWYQRYAVDIYLHATALRTVAGNVPPAWWNQRIAAAAKVLSYIVRPDGTIPLIGDDDGGSLVNFESRDVCDVRPTLSLAARVLGKSALDPWDSATPAVSWMLGPQPDQATNPAFRPPSAAGVTLTESEFQLFFDNKNTDRATLFIDAGSLGRYGHAHGNTLAFDLSIGSEPFIVDPGTLSYIAPVRDQFRSGAAHSTVTLDGEGSSQMDGPFSWSDRAVVSVNIQPLPHVSALRARQEGWRKSAGGTASHERTFIWLQDGSFFVICDRVWDPARRDIGVALQSGAGVTVREESTGVAFQSANHGLVLQLAGSPPPSFAIEPGSLSSCYGRRLEAPRVRISVPAGSQDAGAERILFMTFARKPVSLTRQAWSAADSTLKAEFSNGRTLHVIIGHAGPSWHIT